MTLPEHLRATRRALCPSVVEYRTTDPRVVDAVRMLDTVADEVERLQAAVELLTHTGERMAASLNAAARKSSGQDNTVDGYANDFDIAKIYFENGHPASALRALLPPKRN